MEIRSFCGIAVEVDEPVAVIQQFFRILRNSAVPRSEGALGVDGGVCTDLAKDKFVALAGGLRPDPEFANSKHLVERLRNATGISLGASKPGRIAQRYLGAQHTKTAARSPDRGGVILGCSAGSIILDSFIVSGVSASWCRLQCGGS